MTKRIWIIDDYLPILDCMRMMLELHGYEVKIAQDGNCFTDKEIKPDILLIDYHIPGMDSYGFIQQIKHHSEFKHIPIILMSGHKDIQKISIHYGAEDFLNKPFNYDDLLEKIRRLCPATG